jgi:hypothetical protein
MLAPLCALNILRRRGCACRRCRHLGDQHRLARPEGRHSLGEQWCRGMPRLHAGFVPGRAALCCCRSDARPYVLARSATATTCTTPRCRSAATRHRASAATRARRRCTTSPRPRWERWLRPDPQQGLQQPVLCCWLSLAAPCCCDLLCTPFLPVKAAHLLDCDAAGCVPEARADGMAVEVSQPLEFMVRASGSIEL